MIRWRVARAAALVAVVVAAATGCSGPRAPAHSGPITSSERDTCESSDDCALVEACCGCAAGGRRVAIRKDAIAEYDATRASRCSDSKCAMTVSTHSSCDAEAVCDRGHCRVMPHLQHQQ